MFGDIPRAAGWLALLLALLLVVPAQAHPHAPSQRQATRVWTDTGIDVPSRQFCFDWGQPDVIYSVEGDSTVAYHWAHGERAVVGPWSSILCGPSGLLYGRSASGALVRFDSRTGTSQTIAHMPSAFGRDGTLLSYAMTDGRLWASPDGGLSWQERRVPAEGQVEQIAVAAADGRAIYVLTVAGRAGTSSDHVHYSILFSPDAGVTWDLRRTGEGHGAWTGGPHFRLEAFPSVATPVDTLLFLINPGYPGSSNRTQVYTSRDGARTLIDQGTIGLGRSVHYTHSHEGIIAATTYGRGYSLALSTDGGASWQPLPQPPSEPAFNEFPYIVAASTAPANLFLRDATSLWYSPDGGRSWQDLGPEFRESFQISPYLPLTLLGLRDTHLHAFGLPDAGASLTTPLGPNGAPGGDFYRETGHTLSGPLQRYWRANGGLAQFGFPRTPPFRELNLADGRIYTVQYFERNRLEYHPEHAGTPHEVLLGLLGNQLTAGRRAAGEQPFVPLPADARSDANCSFYPQTGHRLCLGFRGYWEANGGLAIYGYPISEEFTERNPDDGQLYTVQYFERARFEYHPEHRGTRYEVLLGLLGNAVLRERGWMTE